MLLEIVLFVRIVIRIFSHYIEVVARNCPIPGKFFQEFSNQLQPMNLVYLLQIDIRVIRAVRDAGAVKLSELTKLTFN